MRQAVQALGMLLEGVSIRATCRLTGMGKSALLGIMVQAGEACAKFMESAIQKRTVNAVECDEQWAYIAMKRRTAERLGKESEVVGDRYVFTAIDRDSKLLLCWHAGQRSPKDTWLFAAKLFDSVTGCPTICTDGFTSYTSVIPFVFQHNVNYAQMIKHFQNTGTSGAAAIRYSPGSITSVERRVICGNIPEAQIGTSRMERFNLSTRMHVRRFTRLTNAHSKTVRNHDAMLGIYFAWYNWCRNHMTIKTTPAVASGLAQEPWTLERLLTEASKTMSA